MCFCEDQTAKDLKYAIAEGFFVGALSRMYETFFNGIVVQAAGATIAVFAVMSVTGTTLGMPRFATSQTNSENSDFSACT